MPNERITRPDVPHRHGSLDLRQIAEEFEQRRARDSEEAASRSRSVAALKRASSATWYCTIHGFLREHLSHGSFGSEVAIPEQADIPGYVEQWVRTAWVAAADSLREVPAQLSVSVWKLVEGEPRAGLPEAMADRMNLVQAGFVPGARMQANEGAWGAAIEHLSRVMMNDLEGFPHYHVYFKSLSDRLRLAATDLERGRGLHGGQASVTPNRQDPESGGERQPERRTPEAHLRAARSYLWVCEERPDLVPSPPLKYTQDLWLYVKEYSNEYQGIPCPAFPTWKRQVRGGLNQPDDPQATARHGRPHGRSIVSADDI